ncbi:MAG: hypothetical protein MZV63_45760 [Marinilabiliales bacterium]|nr:hypothetical protein [Marinilabiliales bacterium]
MYEDVGYLRIRSSYTMRINMDMPPAAPQWPDGITLRACNPETDLEAVVPRRGRIVQRPLRPCGRTLRRRVQTLQALHDRVRRFRSHHSGSSPWMGTRSLASACCRERGIRQSGCRVGEYVGSPPPVAQARPRACPAPPLIRRVVPAREAHGGSRRGRGKPDRRPASL